MSDNLPPLLPCPFCGNDKNISMANEKHDHSGGYFIACPKCDASTGLRYAMGDDPRPLLAEQWNRRAAIEADRVSRDVPAAGVSDESCDSVILAIDAWARGVDHYEFGLPIHHDDGMVTCRGIIRSVFSATQQVAKPVPRFPFCERKDPHAREMQPVQAQPGGSGGFGQKLFPEVSAFCPKLFPQATGFDTQPKPANQHKE